MTTVSKPIGCHGTLKHGFLEHLKMLRQTSSITRDGDNLINLDATAVEALTLFSRDGRGSSKIICQPDDGGKQEFCIYSVLLKYRIIFLYGKNKFSY